MSNKIDCVIIKYLYGEKKYGKKSNRKMKKSKQKIISLIKIKLLTDKYHVTNVRTSPLINVADTESFYKDWYFVVFTLP